MSENIINQESTELTLGTMKISEQVLAKIAGAAAAQIEGVAGMSGGIADGIAEKLGRKNLSRGVKVEIGEKEVSVNVFIIVNSGIRIPEVVGRIQESIKQALEYATGLKVTSINVHVQGIVFPGEDMEEELKAKHESSTPS